MGAGKVFVNPVLMHDLSAPFFFPSLSTSSLNISSPFHSGSRSSKTFKPKKNIPEGSHQYELLKHAEATLGSGNLRMAVMLPEGEDLNEWVAVNTVDFFNQINMLYGTITDFCTEESCPVMSAGPKYEYHWADGTNIKKPIKCSAPKYIDYLMTWVQDQLDDETLFPSKIGVPFPKNFMSVAKTILKRLFRVYAHIYHQHFDPVIQLQEEAHLNTSFKHFIFFVQEFNLIDRRELAPLQELIEKLTSKDR
uniref:MOB kinase activator 1B n=12 Tax=Amniota TaxID=32524 RepID=A0A8B9NMA6_9AVES